MNSGNDINHISDIRILVDTFYARVQEDELLGPVFNNVIQNQWPEHLEKMYRFWQTVLLGEHTYYGSPFPPHARLPIGEEHFSRWLELFSDTVSALYAGSKADEALWRAQKMAQMFQFKIDHYRKNPNQSAL